jgi:phage terminase Nu1 subunit (DNA packaging protein)
MSEDATATTAELARLFDTTAKTIADLGKRGIIVRGDKRGRWQLEPSVSGYVRHLREEAAGRGGDAGADARARLGLAQATLAEAKARHLSGELIEVAEVEHFGRSKLRAFRNRVLAVPGRCTWTRSTMHA